MNENQISEEIFELSEIYNNAQKKEDLKECLSKIKSKKNKFNKYSFDYITLLHLECVIRQEIYEIGPCIVDEIIPNLNNALKCTTEIQKICEKTKNYQTLYLASMQEATCILTELSRFDDHIPYLTETIKIHEFIRKSEYADNQLIYLSYMNEAKIRFELAKNKIDSKKNCILSLKLSEKSRDYYQNEYNYCEVTYQNQLNALTLLSTLENYGFEIEMKEALKKLNGEISNKELNLYNLQLDAELVELQIEDKKKLDEILDNIPKVKNNLYPEENLYNQLIIFEGEILIKKAKFSENPWDKITYLNQSIEYFNNHLDFNDDYYNIQTLLNIGYAKFELSKLIQAEKNLNEAMDCFSFSANYFEETPLQNNEYFYPLTLLYLSKTSKKLASMKNELSNEYKPIEKIFLYCLEQFNDSNDEKNIIDCYLELGDLFFQIKHYEKAYHYLNKGVDLVEIMRESIPNSDNKIKFFNTMQKLFELIIETCYYLNNKKEALKFVELSKHRTFLDEIIKKQQDDLIKPIPSELVYELKNINSKIKSLSHKLKNCDKFNFKISSTYEKFSKIKKQKNYYLFNIKTNYPEHYNYYYNSLFDYRKINFENKTFIEYYYTENFLLIFLIENDKFILKRVDFEKEKLIKLINEFEKQLENDNNIEKSENILNKLFNMLITPIQKNITHENLIIIPYKGLHNIPFNCLKDDNGNYLIDNYTVTISQSGSSLKYIKNNSHLSCENYLVIGNPTGDLDYAEKEANHISKILKTKPLIKKEATKRNILKNIKGKDIIHFSGHGRFDTKNPLNSSLVLYNNEKLYISDLTNLNLNSELVVLSACETAIVSIDESDETEGFVKYLQIDGTKYIIASLWQGFDKAAYELFEKFYSTSGDYSTRLRLAQLELKKNNNIFYWGNFQIYGI